MQLLQAVLEIRQPIGLDSFRIVWCFVNLQVREHTDSGRSGWLQGWSNNFKTKSSLTVDLVKRVFNALTVHSPRM